MAAGLTFFDNQALSTPLANYSCRAMAPRQVGAVPTTYPSYRISGSAELVTLFDARESMPMMRYLDHGSRLCRLSELRADFRILPRLASRNDYRKVFPDWYSDSKRALSATGTGETFRRARRVLQKPRACTCERSDSKS